MRPGRNPAPMRVLVASEPDEASMNQRAALLALGAWKEDVPFEGRPSWRQGPWRLVTIRELHLERDGLDRDLEAAWSQPPELVVYLSKHRSESRTPSLTVHAVGNPHAAEMGGRPGTLVPAAPGFMTAALRRLRAEARGLPYDVTFEATHHGPYLETPTFYIEQGSTEAEWRDTEAARAIARALLPLEPLDAPVAVGLGGGHYAPRHTDLAKAYRIAFGHILASYALDATSTGLVEQAADRTPGASLAYLHRKTLGKADVRGLEARLAARGLRVVREADLEPDLGDKTS